jgi:hypothetical protein
MSYSISGNTLTFANKTNVDFEDPILKVLEVEGLLIIVLDTPNGKNDNRNVFAFSIIGDYLWQIKNVELYYNGDWCPCTDVAINKESEIVLFNWGDTAVVIKPQDGEVLRRYLTK